MANESLQFSASVHSFSILNKVKLLKIKSSAQLIFAVQKHFFANIKYTVEINTSSLLALIRLPPKTEIKAFTF